MRWFWIDKYTEFVCGDRATAIKNVALSEEQLHDHFPGWPVMPHALIVEGMAQTGGLLVNASSDFQERVVLAKLGKVVFHFDAVPGDTLVYQAKIEQIKKDGAMVTTTSHVGERLQAEAEIFFAHLDHDSEDHRELFDPQDLLNWLTLLKVFEIGVQADGSPLRVPAALAQRKSVLE